MEITKIDRLRKALLKVPETQISDAKSEIGLGCRYEHSFVPGLYIRKMFIPKGLIIVTELHKTEHPYFIMTGDVTIYLNGETSRIVAPYTGITKPGTRRALYTNEDTIWITVHVTDKTDIEEIKKDVIAESYDDLPALPDEGKKQITESGGGAL